MNALETVPQTSLPSRFYEPIPISSFPRINLHRNKAVVQLCISLSSCIRPPVAGTSRLEQRINTVGPVIVNRLFWWLAVLVVSLLGFVDGNIMVYKCISRFVVVLFLVLKIRSYLKILRVKKNRQHDISKYIKIKRITYEVQICYGRVFWHHIYKTRRKMARTGVRCSRQSKGPACPVYTQLLGGPV